MGNKHNILTAIGAALTNALTIVSVIFYTWLFLSWLNVVLSRPNISQWNLFNFILVHAEEQEVSLTAEHEMMKGQRLLIIEPKYEWDDIDYYYLAHIINAEAGADYCSDELMAYVGSVVINRMESPLFPDTIKEVIEQPGQYQPTWSGTMALEPSDRAWEIACELLEHGSVLPSDVLYQAEFPQGSGIYLKEQNMYFCYQ